MNIAVASSGLGHVARGIESWAADLGRALHDRGTSVRLYKGGGRAEAPYEHVVPCWQREGRAALGLLRFRRLLWRLGFGSGYGIEQVTFTLNLIGRLRRDRIDVLHVQDPGVALIVQKARRLGLVSTRVVLAHGTEEPNAFLSRIDYLQHLAPWHLEEARDAGCWKPTWTAIPNFIDTERFHPGPSDALRAELAIPPGVPIVLTAAAIKRHHKRVDYLLDEFATLTGSDKITTACLVVAGGWEPETDALIAQGQAQLGDRVRFLVRFPRERMPELYRLADVFVLASLKEMMPIALLEATASGLPCLVHRHPVLEWIVGPGGEALDMAAPGALGAALSGLLGDEARRSRLGDLARQHCEELFGRDRVVDQILDYYRDVLGHDGAGEQDARAGLPIDAGSSK